MLHLNINKLGNKGQHLLAHDQVSIGKYLPTFWRGPLPPLEVPKQSKKSSHVRKNSYIMQVQVIGIVSMWG